MPQKEQPEIHRRPARYQVDEGVMVKARQHANRKLVREVPDGLLGPVAERQMRVLPGIESALQMTDEISPLVAGRTKPGACWLVEHHIEEHHALDHPPLSGGLPESVVRLANGRPERLVVNVKHPAAMKLASRNRCCESSLDERLDEVGALLAVDDAGERAVPGARRRRRSAAARCRRKRAWRSVKPNDAIALRRSAFAMSIVHRSGGGGSFIRAAPRPAVGDETLRACRCSRSRRTCRRWRDSS